MDRLGFIIRLTMMVAGALAIAVGLVLGTSMVAVEITQPPVAVERTQPIPVPSILTSPVAMTASLTCESSRSRRKISPTTPDPG